jgi:hypothetical protein
MEPKQLGALEVKNLEVMKIPEFVVREEEGVRLLSIILKGSNPEWGASEEDHPLVGEINQYFKENPIEPEIAKFISGANEEAAFVVSLGFNNPESRRFLIDYLTTYKRGRVSDPETFIDWITEILISMKNSLPDYLKQSFAKYIESDIQRKKEKIEYYKEIISKIIDFYKPSVSTTNIKQITILPTDFLVGPKSGRARSINQELIIQSHIDNPHNFEHEFLHSVINPIADKLGEVLSEDQKNKISEMVNGRLKLDYGDYYYSLLCEELIRTYNNIFQQGGRPDTYEVFANKIKDLDEVEFQKLLVYESLRKGCDSLDIKNVEDFRNKSREYFDRFKKDEFEILLFRLYEEYAKDGIAKYGNFEQFILKRLPQ